MPGRVQPADAHDAAEIFVRFFRAARLYGAPMLTDAELLQRYARDRDEKAFAELVRRHLGVVYGAALRRTGGRAHLAEEIAQQIFTHLARKAAVLCHHPVLTGWLHRSTRYAAIDAVRAEQRRQKLNDLLAAMPDAAPASDPLPDWERLRPVLDEAVDGLKDGDREAVLLRYFQNLSFAEIGARLRLSENAARMRTERALDKLRRRLARRGVSSTAAALSVLLSEQAFATAPANLAASVTSAAVSVAPATGWTVVVANVLANKPAAAVIGAALAVGLTVVGWTFADTEAAAELTTLRAENARLVRAASTVPADVRTTRVVQALGQRIARRPAVGGHRDRGLATPYEACLTFWWALDTGDAAMLKRILTYTETGREAIRALHAGMPADIRARYPAPEDLAVFLYQANALLNPPARVDYLEKIVPVETGPDRAVIRRPGTTTGGGQNWVRTAEGWKLLVPDRHPAHVAQRMLGSEALAKLGEGDAP